MSRGISFVSQILLVAALSLICLSVVLQLFAAVEKSIVVWIEVLAFVVALAVINATHVNLALRWRDLAKKERNREVNPPT